MPTFSFILPIFNEQETIPELFQKMRSLMDSLSGSAEVILVDDGSRDGSLPLLLEMHQADSRFKVIKLARNFGHQLAISAGMDQSTGEATIIMDADLQDPPEVVHQMILEWKKGYEIVYAVRKERKGDGVFKKFTASLFYRMLNHLTDVAIPKDVGDFRLVDRKAMDAFKKLREHSRYVRGLFSWIGFKQIGIEYIRNPRFAGKTKYPLSKMLRLAKDAVISFSNAPLRLALNLGFWISGVAFLAGLWALGIKLFGGFTVQGWTSLAVLIAFLGGTQLIVIGILGEYIGRIYEEVKNRPLYLVDEMHGFQSTPLETGSRAEKLLRP